MAQKKNSYCLNKIKTITTVTSTKSRKKREIGNGEAQKMGSLCYIRDKMSLKTKIAAKEQRCNHI